MAGGQHGELYKSVQMGTKFLTHDVWQGWERGNNAQRRLYEESYGQAKLLAPVKRNVSAYTVPISYRGCICR